MLRCVAHLEQLHERHRALILDHPALHQQRAYLCVVDARRLGRPRRLYGLHARVLPLGEARRDVDAQRARLLRVERWRFRRFLAAAAAPLGGGGGGLSELLEQRQFRVAHVLD